MTNQWTPYHFELNVQGEPVRCVIADDAEWQKPIEWAETCDCDKSC